MRKSPEAFRTISEAAEILQTPAHVLRFWESKFTQLKPVKRAGGRRYYRPADLLLVSGIRTLLHDNGMTIRGVQRLLQEKGARHVAEYASDRARTMLGDEPLELEADPAVGLPPGGAGTGAPSPRPEAAEPFPDPVAPDQVAEAPIPDDAAVQAREAAREPAPPDPARAAPAAADTAPPARSAEPAEQHDRSEDAQPEAPVVESSASPEVADAPLTEAETIPEPVQAGSDGRLAGQTPATSVPDSREDPESRPDDAGIDAAQVAALLRRHSRRTLVAERKSKAREIAGRLDSLLNRMSQLGGAPRW